MALSEPLRTKLEETISSHKVVLFMKGTRRQPQCGFSAAVVEALDGLVADYATIDVLSDPSLRDGIKEFSSWPTIPQLYVGGTFVGGCDIVREMRANGDLERLLAEAGAPVQRAAGAAVPIPSVALTAAAKRALEGAAGNPGDVLHLEIDARFEPDLFFAPKLDSEIEAVADGIRIAFDPASARRADGVTIDFVEAADGRGFRIDNPNAPPQVKSIDAPALAALLARDPEVALYDVRTDAERNVASVTRARKLDAASQRDLLAADKSKPVVVMCHHGVRSRAAAEALVAEGFRVVYNLEGGIDAWSRLVDPNVPRY